MMMGCGCTKVAPALYVRCSPLRFVALGWWCGIGWRRQKQVTSVGRAGNSPCTRFAVHGVLINTCKRAGWNQPGGVGRLPTARADNARESWRPTTPAHHALAATAHTALRASEPLPFFFFFFESAPPPSG